jgi:GDPmannose 4,6-dehydratase
VPALLGDSTKARKVLGWKPTVSFKELCRMMLESDLSSKGFTLEQAGKKAQTLKSRKANAK